MTPRYLAKIVVEDALSLGKMAFITGPRQVGRSTLSQNLLTDRKNYFLFDDEDFRRRWAKSPSTSIALRGTGPIVLDEIHKDRKWKSKLKGIYDLDPRTLPIIVTGSARFDYFRKGNDSLLGRYLPYRLHPFSVAESQTPKDPKDLFNTQHAEFSWQDLLRLGGFPEPFLSGKEGIAQRWSRLRLDRLISEDACDFRNISDLNAFRILIDLLPERVGSLLSVNSLKEDVGKAYATVRDWLQILDVLYYLFLIRPYHRKLKRTLTSEPKLYLYDLLRIPERFVEKRLENLTALHLLKACHFWTDSAQGEFELFFLRNKDKREVDFLVTKNERPWILVECKSNRKQPSEDVVFFANILKPEYAVQLVTDPAFDKVFSPSNVRILGYEKFFSYWI